MKKNIEEKEIFIQKKKFIIKFIPIKKRIQEEPVEKFLKYFRIKKTKEL